MFFLHSSEKDAHSVMCEVINGSAFIEYRCRLVPNEIPLHQIPKQFENLIPGFPSDEETRKAKSQPRSRIGVKSGQTRLHQVAKTSTYTQRLSMTFLPSGTLSA